MKPRVLVVDDSALSRRTLRQILEPAGYDVAEAEDGLSALERYFLDKPDVVLLDLVMKGMYGLEVLTKLRELDAGRQGGGGFGGHSDLVARAGRRGRRQGVRQQAVRQSRDPESADHRPRRRRRMKLTAAAAGRAGRGHQHRIRPRRRLALEADGPARAARGAANHDVPGRRAERAPAADGLGRRCQRPSDLFRIRCRRCAAGHRSTERLDSQGAVDERTGACRSKSTPRRGKC